MRKKSRRSNGNGKQEKQTGNALALSLLISHSMKVRGEKAFGYVMPAIDVKYTEIEAGGKAKQEEIKNEVRNCRKV